MAHALTLFLIRYLELLACMTFYSLRALKKHQFTEKSPNIFTMVNIANVNPGTVNI